MADKGHVLVYQIGSLGDTIVSIPCYRAIRRHFKGRKVHLLEAKLEAGRVAPSSMLLREGLIDGVTNYQHTKGGTKLKSQVGVWKAVVGNRPHTVVYLGPAERAPSVVERDKLFFKLCGVRNLVGFHGVDYTQFRQRDSEGYLPRMPHQSQMRLNRLAQDGVEVRQDDVALPLLNPTMEEREKALDWLEGHRKQPGRKLVTLGFMTAKGTTRWPIERFEALGQRLIDTGQVEIIVTGGPADADMARHLVATWGEGAVAAGAFGIHDMAALLSNSDLFIGLDTGTTHLAAAVRTPILGIYADHLQPGEWDPMGDGHQLIVRRVPCGGCRVENCPVTGHPCMTGISVDEVFVAAVKRLGIET